MIEFSPLLAMLVAFGLSSVMSVGGISGAFLLLPFQVSVLGFTGPAVTPTNHLYNVVAIPGGVYRYAREGRLLRPLAMIIVIGTVPGVIIGSLIRILLLPDPRNFKLFIGCVLVLIGSRFLHRVMQRSSGTKQPAPGRGELEIEVRRSDWRRLEYTFQGESHQVSVPQLLMLTAVVGTIGGTYGIGGGSIVAPLLVWIWNLPVHTTAGATLLATMVTSVVGVAFFALYGLMSGAPSITPNWALGLCFGFGGLCGTYCGARLQRFLPAVFIEWLLALVITGLGVSYIVRFILSTA